jgi:hypothetical protein
MAGPSTRSNFSLSKALALCNNPVAARRDGPVRVCRTERYANSEGVARHYANMVDGALIAWVTAFEVAC